MFFGVCLPNFGKNSSPSAIRLVAENAERLGYHSIWATDHLALPPKYSYPYGRIFEPLTVMAYTAPLTERVMIGSSVIILPMRNPVITAKTLSTLDSLCGGRVIAGFGAGWAQEEFENLGASFHDRGRRFDEALELVKTMWREDRFSFAGRYYKVSEALSDPRPAQKDGPPIWVGGNSLRAYRRALHYGVGWHFTGLPPEDVRTRLSTERPPNGFTISGRFTVDLTGRTPKVTRSPLGEVRQMLSGKHGEVVDMIKQYASTGVSYFVCYFGDRQVEEYLAHMRAFISDVIPSL
ncbi:F420-dependent hydroxymycolic acid dehydrogenase [archaeon HR01]|nr:F420-dependent hydroxymycolic acid dehydrogenase [archaeon HR01]